MQPTPNLLARASWDTMHAVIRSAACSLLGHPFPTQCGLGTSTATRAPHPTLTCMLRVGLAAPASSGQTEPVKYIEAGLCRSTWDRVSPALRAKEVPLVALRSASLCDGLKLMARGVRARSISAAKARRYRTGGLVGEASFGSPASASPSRAILESSRLRTARACRVCSRANASVLHAYMRRHCRERQRPGPARHGTICVPTPLRM